MQLEHIFDIAQPDINKQMEDIGEGLVVYFYGLQITFYQSIVTFFDLLLVSIRLSPERRSLLMVV